MGRDVGRFTNRRSCRRIQGCLVRRLHGMISSLRSPLVSPTQQYRCNPAEKPDLHRRPPQCGRRPLVGMDRLSPPPRRSPTKRGSSRTILSYSPVTRGHGKSLPRLMEARRTFAGAEDLTLASLQPGWGISPWSGGQGVRDIAIELVAQSSSATFLRETVI
jgi:hypothetical protein